MGDIADMILEGILCDLCGTVFEDMSAPGHPRTCEDCLHPERLDGPLLPPSKRSKPTNKSKCPICGKLKIGLTQHIRDSHPNHPNTPT